MMGATYSGKLEFSDDVWKKVMETKQSQFSFSNLLESFGSQIIDFCWCYNIGVVQATALDISPDRKGWPACSLKLASESKLHEVIVLSDWQVFEGGAYKRVMLSSQDRVGEAGLTAKIAVQPPRRNPRSNCVRQFP